MVVGLNFDTPVAATNFFPPGERMSSALNLFTPKLIRDRASGRLLTFDESLEMPLALTYDARRLADRGLEAVDNDAEDVLGLAEEMIEKVEGRAVYSDDDERLQRRWSDLGSAYSTGDAGSRIGRAFLRRHRDLFRPW
jgi:putative glycosyltransferase (TIGR04372 family)